MGIILHYRKGILDDVGEGNSHEKRIFAQHSTESMACGVLRLEQTGLKLLDWHVGVAKTLTFGLPQCHRLHFLRPGSFMWLKKTDL